MIFLSLGPCAPLPAPTLRLAVPKSNTARCHVQQKVGPIFYRPRALSSRGVGLSLRMPTTSRPLLVCKDANSSAQESWEDRLKMWLPLAVSGVVLATAIYNTSSSFKGISDQIEKNQLVILEKFANVDAKFAHVDTRFANVDARFANVDAKFANMDIKINAVAERIDALEKRLLRLENKLNVVKGAEKAND